MEVNCETLAVMGSTLANGGVCPITSEAALGPEAVRDVLSLMHRWISKNLKTLSKEEKFVKAPKFSYNES